MSIKETAYQLMVILGTIQDEMNKGTAEAVSLEEINQMYDLASTINEHFENQ